MKHESKLGTIPEGNEGRDATHVAIVPAIAAQILERGTPVKFNDYNKAIPCMSKEAIGIVDPFRPDRDQYVHEGKLFWLCLYPKTITDLRHVWEHPLFQDNPMPASAKDDNKSASYIWLKNYVRQHCPYAPDDVERFLDYVKHERWIYFHGTDCHSLGDVDDADELFKHLSILLDRKIDASYFNEFTCSC